MSIKLYIFIFFLFLNKLYFIIHDFFNKNHNYEVLKKKKNFFILNFFFFFFFYFFFHHMKCIFCIVTYEKTNFHHVKCYPFVSFYLIKIHTKSKKAKIFIT